MKITKIALTVIGIVMIGVVLSSCKVTDKIISKDSDMKLLSGIKFHNSEIINEALEDGANINKINGMLLSESNPVAIALNDARLDVASYLIKRGADANYKYKSGNSLLMDLAYNSNADFCDLLLKHGAKIDVVDENGETALDKAVRSFHEENQVDKIITLLLNNGAKFTSKTLDAAMRGDLSTGTPNEKDVTWRYGIVKRVLEGVIKAGYKSNLDPTLEASIFGQSSKVKELVVAGKMNKESEKNI